MSTLYVLDTISRSFRPSEQPQHTRNRLFTHADMGCQATSRDHVRPPQGLKTRRDTIRPMPRTFLSAIDLAATILFWL